jgi:hypothetical protein
MRRAISGNFRFMGTTVKFNFDNTQNSISFCANRKGSAIYPEMGPHDSSPHPPIRIAALKWLQRFQPEARKRPCPHQSDSIDRSGRHHLLDSTRCAISEVVDPVDFFPSFAMGCLDTSILGRSSSTVITCCNLRKQVIKKPENDLNRTFLRPKPTDLGGLGREDTFY